MKTNRFLAVAMLAASMMLASCGNAPETPSSSASQSSSSSSSSSVSSDPSNPSESTPSESTPGSTSQASGTQTDNLKSLAELEAAIGHHFHFEYHPNASLTGNSFNQDETLHYATDGTYTAINEGYDRLWVNIGGRSHSYGKLVDGQWLSLSSPTTEVVSVAEGRARETMMQFVGSIEYTSKEATTFLNRNATKYTLEISEGDRTQPGFYELFSETIIDNETGLALRHYSRQSGQQMRTLPLCFEVSALNIGDSADAYIATMTPKINIYDWDASFFTALGFGGVARPNEPFWYAERKYGADDDDFVERYETYFHFEGSQAETMAKAKPLVQAFYEAGLQYDEYGNRKSSYDDEDLYWEDDEEGDITFDAFTASGQRVDFDFEYSNYTNPKYMNVSLQFFRV